MFTKQVNTEAQGLPMRKDSYESILSAVGRVLDYAGARSFDVCASDGGLHVETFDAEGKPEYTFQFGLPDLVELLEWSGAGHEKAPLPRTISANEGTLSHFLDRRSRELVGTYR